jgi:branched-chain amino acid aminotransferase
LSAPASTGVVSVDGVITPLADGRVPVMDHGFLFGDSIYEVIRTLGGRPVAFAQHLERLRHSAHATYLQIPWTDTEISARVRAAVAASGFAESYVRLVVTRGVGPMTLLPDPCRDPGMVVIVMPLVLPSRDEFERGMGVAIPARLRNDRRALAPSSKTGNYMNNLLALVEAKRAGGDDAVMVNVEGHVTEATTANVFWVKDGEVLTPSLECGILAGITRTLLIWAMRQDGISVVEGSFPAADLRGADEAFLTGTIRGVSPVVRVDGRAVGDGLPGPMTRRIDALNARVLEAHTQDW